MRVEGFKGLRVEGLGVEMFKHPQTAAGVTAVAHRSVQVFKSEFGINI